MEQEAVSFLEQLRARLQSPEGFNGADAIKSLLDNGIASSPTEASFVMQILLGHNIITNDNNSAPNHLTFQSSRTSHYNFNENYQISQDNSFWINFIPKFNSDPLRQTHLQPTVPFMSPVMKYAKLYSSHYAPSQTLGIKPMDRYNHELLNNVHPPNWTNPVPPKEGYNLVAIGAGAAGLVSAITASRFGGSAAIIDEHLFGGDCLNTGCVPSKALLKSAKLIYDLTVKNEKNKFGIHIPSDAMTVDFGEIMERMRKVRASISKHDAVGRFSSAPYDIDCFLGRAVFVDEHTLKVDGQLIHFERCVICTGAISNVPPIGGLDNIEYLTSHSIWNLEELPSKLGIIGGGPIGCEMAQSFALFGSEVTMLDLMPRILNKEDPEAAAIVHQSIEECGVTFALNQRVVSVENMSSKSCNTSSLTLIDELLHLVVNDGSECKDSEQCPNIKVVTADGTEYVFSQLLIATGRKPNVEGMGLEAAKIEFDTVRGVKVNDFLETSNPKVYAAGDCCNAFQFTHMVDACAKIVVPNALFHARKRVSSLISYVLKSQLCSEMCSGILKQFLHSFICCGCC